MRRSIRASLQAGTALGTVVVLLLAGFAMDRAVRSAVLDEMDRTLDARARMLVSGIELTPEGLDLQFDELDLREFEPGDEPSYLVVRVGTDSIAYVSPSLGEIRPAPVPARLDESVFGFASFDGERRLRRVDLSVRARVDLDEDGDGDKDEGEGEGEGEGATIDEASGEGPPVPLRAPAIHLTLARGTERIDAVAARLRHVLAAVGLAAALVALLLQRAVVARSLAPLDELARDIARVGEDLSRRVRVPGEREVRPLGERLNELLTRLEAAFVRERTFSADVAHELRTPLAGLRTSLEVELAQPRAASEYRATLVTALEIVVRMQDMVGTLLELGRLDAGEIALDTERVDLAEMVQRTWQPLASRAAKRDLEVIRALPAAAPLVTDGRLLHTLVRNVLENAVEHTAEHGRVEITVRNGDAGTSLAVANSGSRVAAQDTERLLARFARGDTARSSTGMHYGLGLALVDKIATTLGMRLELTTDVGGDFRVVVSAPPTAERGCHRPARAAADSGAVHRTS